MEESISSASVIVVLVAQSCPWTAACQAPLSVKFLRQEYWSGLPCPPPGDCSDPGMEPWFPTMKADSFHLGHQGSPAVPPPLSNAVRPLDLKLSFASCVFPVMLFVPGLGALVCIMCFSLLPKWSPLLLLLARGLSLFPRDRAWGMAPIPALLTAPKQQRGRRRHPCGYLGAWLSHRPSSGLRSHRSLLGRSRSCLSQVPLPPQSSEAGRRPWARAPALCSRRWTALGRQPPSPASLVPGQPRAPRWEPRRQVRQWRRAGGVGSRF